MKKYKLLVALPLLSTLLVSCGNGGAQLIIPTFAKSKGIKFTAYAGPTVEKWGSGDMNPNGMTDENFKKMSEGGFNKIIALYEGAVPGGGTDTFEVVKKRAAKAEKDAMQALPLCEKYGMKYYVRDWSFYGLVKNYTAGYEPNILTDEQYEQVLDILFTEDNPYVKSPAYAGNFCDDEPTYEAIDRIAVQVRLYYEKMKALGVEGEPIVNLYPCSVGAYGISSTGEKTYEDYIDHYFELISSQTGYACYDFYPFINDFYDGSIVKSNYLYNLNLFAQRCKAQNIELRTFMQSVGNWTGMRDMVGIGDFRFQIYCELAFGSHECIYYEFGNKYSEAQGGYALYDYMNDRFNWTFDCAAKVNNEVHAFEDALLSYNWDGFMYKNADVFYDNPAFSFIEEDAYTEHDRVAIKDCEQDCFMGTFKNDEDDDAFMLVNYTDPYKGLNNKVTLHFNNAKGLLMWRMGQKMIVNLPKSGDYTFDLYPGEGRFIIPLN